MMWVFLICHPASLGLLPNPANPDKISLGVHAFGAQTHIYLLSLTNGTLRLKPSNTCDVQQPRAHFGWPVLMVQFFTCLSQEL